MNDDSDAAIEAKGWSESVAVPAETIASGDVESDKAGFDSSDGRPQQASFVDLLVAVFLSWSVQLFVGLCMGIVARGQNSASRAAVTSQLMTFAMPVSLGLSFGLSYYFVCRKYGSRFRDGFEIRGMRALDVVRFTAIAFGLVAFALGSLSAAYVIAPESLSGTSKVVQAMSNPGTAWLWMLFALCAPLLEELFFRGFAFPVLQRTFNTRAAVWLVAAWFAAAHMPQVAGDWPSIIGITAVSIVLTILRARTGSLSPCILVHLLYNTVLVGLSSLSPLASSDSAPEVVETYFTGFVHLVYRG